MQTYFIQVQYKLDSDRGAIRDMFTRLGFDEFTQLGLDKSYEPFTDFWCEDLCRIATDDLIYISEKFPEIILYVLKAGPDGPNDQTIFRIQRSELTILWNYPENFMDLIPNEKVDS